MFPRSTPALQVLWAKERERRDERARAFSGMVLVAWRTSFKRARFLQEHGRFIFHQKGVRVGRSNELKHRIAQNQDILGSDGHTRSCWHPTSIDADKVLLGQVHDAPAVVGENQASVLARDSRVRENHITTRRSANQAIPASKWLDQPLCRQPASQGSSLRRGGPRRRLLVCSDRENP